MLFKKSKSAKELKELNNLKQYYNVALALG